jgi:hypothetical protein
MARSNVHVHDGHMHVHVEYSRVQNEHTYVMHTSLDTHIHLSRTNELQDMPTSG